MRVLIVRSKRLFSIFFSVVVLLFHSCSSKENNEIKVINIEKSFLNSKRILLSDLVDSVEYIPLETRVDNLIGRNVKVFANEEFIITLTTNHVFLFDRKSGKFIHEIGNQGLGPDEYYSALSFFEINHTIQCISSNTKDRIDYGTGGEIIRKNKTPKDISPFQEYIPLNDSVYVSYIDNFTGKDPNRIIVFDNRGDSINMFPNNNTFFSNRLIISNVGALFFKKNDHTYFFENCLDTIYEISTHELSPRMYFNMGKFSPPYEKKGEFFDPPQNPPILDYFTINRIQESDKYILFNFNYQRNFYFGYYDKISNETQIGKHENSQDSRLFNDIDNFISIGTKGLTVNNNDELVLYIDAWEITEWFDTYPENKENLSKDIQRFSKLNSDDNPVVVIAKLKKH